MSAHDHTEFVPGCFRCDLSRDEVRASSVADRLREAAALLRKRAEAATVCPQPPFAAETPWTTNRGHVKDAGGWTVCQGKGPEVGAYIAMMHPHVAQALADLLDDLADHDPSPLMPTEAGAFKVADAILGADR